VRSVAEKHGTGGCRRLGGNGRDGARLASARYRRKPAMGGNGRALFRGAGARRLAVVPSRGGKDRRDGLPASGSPTSQKSFR
jgi:hypothetical protein